MAATEAPPPKRGRRWLWLAVLPVVLLGWLGWRSWPTGPLLPPDPRLTFARPFLNVRPDVQYVGDAVCAGCHQDIAETYQQHPMGRAMYPTPSAPELERYTAEASNPFHSGGLRYDITRRDEKVLHAETLQDDKSTPLAKLEEEAVYAIGSGTHGRSYLVNRGGFLFESPISWYTQKRRWDLSPGYHQSNSHFERPVQASCLFCHCNHAHEIPHTVNRYEPPIFTGFAIGCERCHGPGALHAAQPKKVDGIDPTIVNPKHLAPELREHVCQQCHLLGDPRITKAGRGTFDYRPGLPLHQFLAIFVKPPELTKGLEAVSQVEQMHASRCFQASNGSMGCTSCHDPHRAPAADQKAALYRQRCLKCHEQKPCSVPEPTRRQTSADDSCTHCHMPTLGSNIAHTALTDHRVLRRANDPKGAEGGNARSASALIPLRHFHADELADGDPDHGRDLGLAIVDIARRIEMQGPIAPLVRKAQPLLEAGLKSWPGDAPAWQALAYCYRKQSKPAEARQALEASLRHAPEREQSLADLTTFLEEQGLTKEAIASAERLVRANPQLSTYHVTLARLLHADAQWERSRDACTQALRLNITKTDARQLLITNLLRLGDADGAKREFDLLLKTQPHDRTQLESWFAELKRGR
jgi:predicted CXXCH cytochrome family protein